MSRVAISAVTEAGDERSFALQLLSRLARKPVRLSCDYAPPSQPKPDASSFHRFRPSAQRSTASNASAASASGENSVTFVVKPLKGSGPAHTVTLARTATIHDLKLYLEPLTGFASVDQRLVIKGKALQDGQGLSDYNITGDSVVHILAKPGAVPTIPISAPSSTTPPAQEGGNTSASFTTIKAADAQGGKKAATDNNPLAAPQFWLDLRRYLRQQAFPGGSAEADAVTKEFMNAVRPRVGHVTPESLDS